MDLDLDSELKISDEVTTIVDGVDVRDDKMASMLKSTFGFGLTVIISIGLSTAAIKTPSCGNLFLPMFLLIGDSSVVESP
jgi:hypothetical protein